MLGRREDGKYFDDKDILLFTKYLTLLFPKLRAGELISKWSKVRFASEMRPSRSLRTILNKSSKAAFVVQSSTANARDTHNYLENNDKELLSFRCV